MPKPKLAVLGVGIMGRPIAEQFLRAKYPVAVYNRTFVKVAPLKKIGALVFRSPAEAIAFGDIILLLLSDAAAIKETLFTGLFPSKSRVEASIRPFFSSGKGSIDFHSHAFNGRKVNNRDAPLEFKEKLVLQMGTIAPEESQDLERRIKILGGQYAECPVLGSMAEAREGRLILMLGANTAQSKRLQPLLRVLGSPLDVGPVGSAALLKLCLNQLIALHIVAFTQSLALIEKNHLKVKLFMQVLRQSSLYAPMFDKKLARLLNHDYANPNFSTAHMLKDVRLFIREAQSHGIETGVLKSIRKILEKTMEQGFAQSDYCALAEIVRG